MSEASEYAQQIETMRHSRVSRKNLCAYCGHVLAASECGYKPTHYWQAKAITWRARRSRRETASSVVDVILAIMRAAGFAVICWFVVTHLGPG